MDGKERNQGRRTVLIVGTYCGLNKGDRLMQQVIADAVRAEGAVPVVSSPFPDIDGGLYPGIAVVRSGRRNLPLSLFHILVLGLLPRRWRPRYARASKSLGQFVSASLIVDASGDMLTIDYGPHVAVSHCIPLLIARLLDKDLIILAQSIGPFGYLGWLFDSVLRHARKITTRDEISYDYLAARGLNNLLSVADLGFLLPAVPPGGSAEGAPGGTRIGLCPSALFFSKFAKSRNVSEESLCRALDDVADELEIGYVLLPHVLTPSGKLDDHAMALRLEKRLKAPVTVVDPALSPAEIKYVISQLDGVVSFRMHGAIAALDTHVPTIAVSYSHKTVGLFRKLAIEQWLIANDEHLDRNLCDRLIALCKAQHAYREHLRRVMPGMREAARKNIAVLSDYLR